MIQRIQTLYLLLVVVLTGLALWLPLVDFTVGADTCTLTAFGLKDAAGITGWLATFAAPLLAEMPQDRLVGVVVRDQRAAPQLHDALRITLGTPEQNNRVIDALAALESAA